MTNRQYMGNGNQPPKHRGEGVIEVLELCLARAAERKMTWRSAIVLPNEIDDKERTNEFRLTGNLIHCTSIKCGRVTMSVLASELYGTVLGADI